MGRIESLVQFLTEMLVDFSTIESSAFRPRLTFDLVFPDAFSHFWWHLYNNLVPVREPTMAPEYSDIFQTELSYANRNSFSWHAAFDEYDFLFGA